jgi:hypothetical protein
MMKHFTAMKRSPRSFLLLVAVVCATLHSPRLFAQSEEARSADYDVYSAFLKSQLDGHNGIDDLRVGEHAAVLAPITISFTSSSLLQHHDLMERLKGLQDSTLESFEKCSSNSLSLSKNFSIDVPYDVASRDDVASVETFLSRYPENHCLIYLSCVGFNRKETQALFVAERQMCHSGVQKYILMRKDPAGIWRLQDVAVGWIQ